MEDTEPEITDVRQDLSSDSGLLLVELLIKGVPWRFLTNWGGC